jgi:hypothetical protein
MGDMALKVIEKIELKRKEKAEVNALLRKARGKRKIKDLGRKFYLIHRQIEVLMRIYFRQEHI